MKDYSDEQLMKAYQEGNMEAFNELYRRYSPRTFGFLLKRIERSQAEEVLQQAFFNLHNHRAKFDGERPFAPWFYVLVKNSLYDFYRINKKFESLQHEEGASSDVDLKLDIEKALMGLNSNYKEVLVDRLKRGLEFHEIAENRKTTAINVRKIFSRATLAFKNVFKEEK